MHLGGWGLHHKLFVKPFGQKVLSLPKGILEFSDKAFSASGSSFLEPPGAIFYSINGINQNWI